MAAQVRRGLQPPTWYQKRIKAIKEVSINANDVNIKANDGNIKANVTAREVNRVIPSSWLN